MALWSYLERTAITSISTSAHGAANAATCIALRAGLLGWSFVPVSYTHLDVYKRQVQQGGAPRAMVILGMEKRPPPVVVVRIRHTRLFNQSID